MGILDIEFIENIQMAWLISLCLLATIFFLKGIHYIQLNTDKSQRKAKNNFLYSGFVIGQIMMFIIIINQ